MASTQTASLYSNSSSLLRAFFYVLTASVAILLLVGLGGGLLLAIQNPLTLLQTESTSPKAAMFVPKQAPVMVSLLVNPDRLEAFELAIVHPSQRRRTRTELTRLKQALVGKTGLNYEQDIQPWLGNEITFAVTSPDFDRDSDNGQQPGYLLALSSQDPLQAREFLQLFWQKQAIAGVDLVFEQYAGVKMIYGRQEPKASSQEGEANSTLASAVVGDRFVLFASHPKVLRDAINNVQAPELSLGNTSAYQQAIDDAPDRQISWAYVNLPQLTRWLGNTTADLTANSERLYESLAVALQLDRQGFVADTMLLTAGKQALSPIRPQRSEPVEALQFIPATSPLAAAGVNLQQFQSQLSEGLAGYDQLATWVEQFQTDLEARWGLERSDWYDWQGEFALGLLPNEQRTHSAWVFVAERTPTVISKIERLDAIAQQQGLSIGTLTLEGKTVSAWTQLSPTTSAKSSAETLTLQAQVQGVHATVGEYEVFATSVDAMNQALQAPSQTLATAAAFQQAIAPLTDKNNGYLYADWKAVSQLAEQQLPIVRLAKLNRMPLLSKLRSLTFTSYGSTSTAQKGAIFLRLHNANNAP
jgi:hypothetical protein